MFIEKISYSSWKDFQKCQYMYLQKHIKGIRLPFVGTKNTCFGTAIHYALERGIPMKMKVSEAGLEFIMAFNRELKKSNVILPDKDEWIMKGHSLLENFWEKYFNKFKDNVRKTEWKFKLPLANGKFTINGIIDHITQTKKDGWGIIDWKSGKYKKQNDESEMQLSLYSLALEKLFGVIPEWLALFYLEHDKINFSYRNEKQNRDTEASMIGFYNNIIGMKEEDFVPNLDSCFKFCDYKNTCKHRAGDENGCGQIR